MKNTVQIVGTPKLTIAERVRKFNADAGTDLDRVMLFDFEAQNEIMMIFEELKELQEALKAKDRKEACDALCDIIFVAYGTAAKLGMDLDTALERVCDSNDTKYTDGKLVKNENGKIMKGADYVPPNLDGCY